MYNKVELSGVNTADLKVLTEEEKRALFRRMKQGDHTAREELINGNLRLVLSVIQRFSQRGESMDDLFQVGCIGLIKAIDRFDVDQGVRLSSYGVPMILGELRRYLRDYTAVRVSRSTRDLAYRAMQAKERLTARHLREPTIDEIAAELGLPHDEVVLALEAIVEPVSLYEPVYTDGGDSVYVMDQLGNTDAENEWIDELTMKDTLRELSDRERRILQLRFFRGLTQTEVSAEIGISQAQVSRLEKGVLDRIKERM